jgi:hypothetical protein
MMESVDDQLQKELFLRSCDPVVRIFVSRGAIQVGLDKLRKVITLSTNDYLVQVFRTHTPLYEGWTVVVTTDQLDTGTDLISGSLMPSHS